MIRPTIPLLAMSVIVTFPACSLMNPKPAKPVAHQTAPITSDVQREHQGEIVFMDRSLGLDELTENDLFASTDLGKPIYYRVFLKDSLVNALGATGQTKGKKRLDAFARARVNFRLDGEEFCTAQTQTISGERDFLRRDMRRTALTFRGALTPAADDLGGHMFETKFKKCLAIRSERLAPGTHALEVELVAYLDSSLTGSEVQSAPLAQGTLELVVANNAFTKDNPLLCGYPGSADESSAFQKQVWGLWKGGTVETAKGVHEERTRRWEVTSHPDTGVPIKRTRRAIVAKATTEECYYQAHVFTQDFDGRDYGKMYVSDGSPKQPLPCACLK